MPSCVLALQDRQRELKICGCRRMKSLPTVSAASSRPVFNMLGRLLVRSYRGMGVAELRCVSGCECEAQELDGTWAAEVSLQQILQFRVSARRNRCPPTRLLLVTCMDFPTTQPRGPAFPLLNALSCSAAVYGPATRPPLHPRNAAGVAAQALPRACDCCGAAGQRAAAGAQGGADGRDGVPVFCAADDVRKPGGGAGGHSAANALSSSRLPTGPRVLPAPYSPTALLRGGFNSTSFQLSQPA